MGEPFDAIGFKVIDERTYHELAEEARKRGSITRVKRERGMLQGCCWNIGCGIEIWAMLYETREGLFYTDCRPGFRSRHAFQIYPWEIIEFEEEGEALARGTLLKGEREVSFELQNITEINPADYRERPVIAAISGLAYRAQVNARPGAAVFAPIEKLNKRRKVLENDYAIRGQILSWREVKNSHTSRDIVIVDVDAGGLHIEIAISRSTLKGELKRGSRISTEVWLQGHILSDREVQARYEGIDQDASREMLWQRLRRNN